MSESSSVTLQPWRTEKILPCHLERLAVVYVRQSTLQQVFDHQESTRIQYGLVKHAQAWGWEPERVLVIDEDLGKSAAKMAGRSGFQRLVAEVGLNHVGLILGMDMSRLARSSQDWYQLLEVCALFGTLIADLDGVYDPSHYNDRLLLGLKGTMSEAELHVLKQRLVQGKLNKARRGELLFSLPSGYVRTPAGEVTFDPDEQVQQVIRLIFRKFEQLGSLNQLLDYLVEHDIQLGIRCRSGICKGELEWHRPNRATLQTILKNPAYAGAYAYGRRQTDPRQQQPGQPGSGRVVRQREDWVVLLQDCWAAYISWEQYEWNLAQLRSNQARAHERGAVRRGPALLTGLLVCGKCGRRISVNYYGKGTYHSYLCCQLAVHYRDPVCQRIAGPALDQFITQQVLFALEPAALELSLTAAQHLAQERSELDLLWQKRLERAGFESERARRHYQLVEPENRLVARQLAQDWEAKLVSEQHLKEEYERFLNQHPRQLSPAEHQAILQLAKDIPALWQAPTTTNAQRKEIIRQVIAKIIVTVNGESEKVQIDIEWVGGMITHSLMIRPVAKLENLSFYSELCERIRNLVDLGIDPEDIAHQLNQEHFHPPKRAQQFNKKSVQALMRRLGCAQRSTRSNSTEELAEAEWWLSELAHHLDMPVMTLNDWARRGWLHARQQPTGHRRWIVWADEAEVDRLRQLHQHPVYYSVPQCWLGAASPPRGHDASIDTSTETVDLS